MRASLVSLAGLAALALSLTACDDEVADPEFKPESVPESKPIDDLDETEQQDFCEEAYDWARDIVNDLPAALCNAQGISEAYGVDGVFDLAACRSTREACLADPDNDFDIQGEDGLQCDFSEIDSCGATVGQWSSCFEEATVQFDWLSRNFTCERVADGFIPDENDITLSAECIDLFDDCGSGDEAEGGSTGEPPPE